MFYRFAMVNFGGLWEFTANFYYIQKILNLIFAASVRIEDGIHEWDPTATQLPMLRLKKSHFKNTVG